MKIGHPHHENVVIKPHSAAAITERNKSAWRPIHPSLSRTSIWTPAISGGRDVLYPSQGVILHISGSRLPCFL